MQEELIGRKEERETLERLYKSRKSEFAVLYGRRRVGKTFLVTRHFEKRFTFHCIATANVPFERQIKNFHAALVRYDSTFRERDLPKDWFEAFQYLIELAEKSPNEKKVLFFDELPWFDTHKSDFIPSLEHFWNSWAALRSDILLIGCGSAASWMITKIIRDKGGLHNRITERILLQPFTLQETEAFLKSRGGVYDRYQILELYMAVGGIPFYLDNIRTNRSVVQNIDRMFFSPSGIMRTEYHDLYRSLFKNYERHVQVIEALSKKTYGLNRKELIKASELKDGGSFSKVLKELEQSGFINRYYPFGKKQRNVIYQLSDPYTLFYLTFVRGSKAEGDGAWETRINSPQWNAWSGIVFELICRYHVASLKKHLGIGRVYTETSVWRSTKKKGGAQIDLVLDRNDRVINLCEIKFSQNPFVVSKEYAEKLNHKMRLFREETNTKKTLFLTLIAANGLKTNAYSEQMVRDVLDMGALFD